MPPALSILQHRAAHLPSHALLSGHALGQSAQALLLHPAVHLPLHSLLFGQSAQFFLLHSDVHLPLHSLLAGHALVQAAPAFLLHSTTQVSLHFLTQLFCAKAVVKENTSNIVANSIILFITCFFILLFYNTKASSDWKSFEFGFSGKPLKDKGKKICTKHIIIY